MFKAVYRSIGGTPHRDPLANMYHQHPPPGPTASSASDAVLQHSGGDVCRTAHVLPSSQPLHIFNNDKQQRSKRKDDIAADALDGIRAHTRMPHCIL